MSAASAGLTRPLRHLALVLLAALAAGWPGAVAASEAERDVPLPGGGTLDYLPPLVDAERPPLVAFVANSYWGLRSERSAPAEQLLARPLRAEGVAVALLRHRAAPEASPSAYAEDVAAGVAWLFAEAGRLGFDPDRVLLVGHGSGGQLAALLALDASYLAAHELSPARLAAVVPISALYDLERSEGVPDELLAFAARAYPDSASRRAASPLRHVRGDAPAILALTASDDVPGLSRAADEFTTALRAAGHTRAETFRVPNRDHFSVLAFADARNVARDHLLALAGIGPRAAEMREIWEVRRHWRDPQLTSAGFWEHEDLIEAHEPDPALDAWVQRYFASGGRSRVRAVEETWHAIPLEALLERLGPERVGEGRWLRLDNVRGERAVLDLEAIREYEPQVVVGIGDERNLFRVVDLYHTLRRNTWQQPEPERWLLARPLGAFVFFAKEPPKDLVGGVFGLFALTPESFARTPLDPRAPVRAAAEPALAELLIQEKDCVACHAFAGAGGRAGHLRARDAALVGGFALPLEEYPEKVWRRYVYEQLEVAAEIGATPVLLAPEVQDLLYQGVVRSRKKR